MTDDDNDNEPLVPPPGYSKIIIAAGVTMVILTIITIGAYQYAKKRSGVVVLPGGITYLGPSIAPTSPPAPPAPSKFTAAANVEWKDFKGKTRPFTFSYPSTLTLVTYPNDVTESVSFSWNNIPAQSNIMFRINDINATEPKMVPYIDKPKIEYVKNWWTQYTGGLKGVSSVTEFTNSKGMKGYKAKYLNHANQTPNDDIFFEVPGRTDLMIRFGNGQLDATVFDRIIDTFYWGKSPAKPTTEPKPTSSQGP
jgi:hypothetical protein